MRQYEMNMHILIYKASSVLLNEPHHDKTYNDSWAPNEESDPSSLIRVFVMRFMASWRPKPS